MRQLTCKLTDSFALYVQFAMGVVVFVSLLFKRFYEFPRRPLEVWFFDVTKQGCGAAFVHLMNLLFSVFPPRSATKTAARLAAVNAGEADWPAGNPEMAPFRFEVAEHNPCVFYFLHVLLDTTIGVFLLSLYLRFANYVTSNYPDFKSGFYGVPPRFVNWVKQTCVFTSCLFTMKICVTMIVMVATPLHTLGKIMLSTFDGNSKQEVVFVMLIFPLMMSVTQYWIIDHIIKGNPRVYLYSECFKETPGGLNSNFINGFKRIGDPEKYGNMTGATRNRIFSAKSSRFGLKSFYLKLCNFTRSVFRRNKKGEKFAPSFSYINQADGNEQATFSSAIDKEAIDSITGFRACTNVNNSSKINIETSSVYHDIPVNPSDTDDHACGNLPTDSSANTSVSLEMDCQLSPYHYISSPPMFPKKKKKKHLQKVTDAVDLKALSSQETKPEDEVGAVKGETRSSQAEIEASLESAAADHVTPPRLDIQAQQESIENETPELTPTISVLDDAFLDAVSSTIGNHGLNSDAITKRKIKNGSSNKNEDPVELRLQQHVDAKVLPELEMEEASRRPTTGDPPKQFETADKSDHATHEIIEEPRDSTPPL